MRIKGVVVMAGVAVVVSAAVAASAWAQGGAHPQGGAHGQGMKKGQGWEMFVAAFDANKDGKVTKEEMMAKQPGFDHADANHDGVVTENEFDAMPASKNHPNLKTFIARFDTDHDKKVSLQEWNDARMKAFDAADKNHDGAIEKSEFTPQLGQAGSGK